VPLTTTTMSQLSQQQIGNASGLYNLVRNLGGSVGIAFVTTALARGAQAHQALMVGHLTPTDPAFSRTLAATQNVFAQTHDAGTAKTMAYATIYNTLDQQAHLWAFVDVFLLFGFLALGGIPMILLFKKVKAQSKPSAAAH
jgi:DHA2 family multidrug resistance protein